jgi:hypothetical protein
MGKDAAELKHQQLTQAGWEWRFTGEKPRASHLRENYESLGMETRIEEGVLGNAGDCKSCFEVEGLETGYVTVYTKGQAKIAGRFDDDLFE